MSVFFAVSLCDDEESVVQCGECLGVFAGENADRVRARAQSKPSVIGSMLSKLRPARSEEPPPSNSVVKKPPAVDAGIDAELAALKKRLGK